MKEKAGLVFPDADTFMLEQLQADGSYQADHLLKALDSVTDFSCAIDGGAHVGTWTRILATRFARVIAVEPAPDTVESLRFNTRQCPNVEILEVALGDRFGAVSLQMEPKEIARQNTGARYVQPGGTIPLVAIDSWKLPTLGFLKLDVEGSEYAALRGASQTIVGCRPVVLFENKHFGARYGVKREWPQALLTELGYRHVATLSADEIWVPAS